MKETTNYADLMSDWFFMGFCGSAGAICGFLAMTAAYTLLARILG